jgi:hypothetical protein
MINLSTSAVKALLNTLSSQKFSKKEIQNLKIVRKMFPVFKHHTVKAYDAAGRKIYASTSAINTVTYRDFLWIERYWENFLSDHVCFSLSCITLILHMHLNIIWGLDTGNVRP